LSVATGMPAKVVDASALAAVLFEEPAGDAVEAALEGGELIAPSLLGFEIANVCATKIRRDPANRDVLVAAFAALGELAIAILEVDHLQVVTLAEQTGLSAYDASYLWLAMQRGAELVTLDKQLDKAASRLLMRPR
jgi:predicted nucleic acid-binding protein